MPSPAEKGDPADRRKRAIVASEPRVPTDATRGGRRAPRARLWRLGVAGLLLLSLALPAAWLLGHLIPRHDHFAQRRGTLATVEAASELAHPGGYVSQSARVAADTGLAVELRVLRPAVAQRVPLVVLLGGHRTGRDAISVVGDPGTVAVAALDYPYQGPEKPRGVRESLRTIPAAQQGLLDAPAAVSLALDWLLAQPWVDASRVELMGVSLGVPFAATAGALDGRFQRVWLIHGAVDNRAWIDNRLERRVPNAFLRGLASRLVHLLAYGETFKTAEWAARIAPRPVVIIGASEDEQMPRESVEALYAAAREPKELLWSAGGHVTPQRMDIVQELLAMVRARMAEVAGSE
jgi:dienelactone hydrolase